jgi:hypothetical protein
MLIYILIFQFIRIWLCEKKKVIEVAYNPIIPTHAPTLKQDHKFDSGTSISLLTPQKLFLFSKAPKVTLGMKSYGNRLIVYLLIVAFLGGGLNYCSSSCD